MVYGGTNNVNMIMAGVACSKRIGQDGKYIALAESSGSKPEAKVS